MAEAADFQGTSPSPARRRLRRTTALLSGVPLLAGLLQLPAASPADAAARETAQAPTGAGSVSVSVDSLTPGAPTDGDTVTVSGTVTNKGKQTVTDAHVGLRVGPLLNTRSGIDSVAKDSDDVQGAVGPEIDDKYSEKFSKLTPGVSQRFTLSVPVDELNLGQDGVYPLAVSLAGETSDQPWEQTLGIQRTFLPWQPEGADTKTKTTFMWPLISTVHMTAETGSDEQQTPVFHDDDLAREISPGGRLDRMVALGKDLDVTWVIDPDLLASVEAMTSRYEIPGEGDDNLVGGHQDHADVRVAAGPVLQSQRAREGELEPAHPVGDACRQIPGVSHPQPACRRPGEQVRDAAVVHHHDAAVRLLWAQQPPGRALQHGGDPGDMRRRHQLRARRAQRLCLGGGPLMTDDQAA